MRIMGLLEVKIAQLVKILDLQSIDCRFELAGRRVLFSYGPLASPSFQIATAGSDHSGKKMEVPISG